jgi:hypothetical protein
VLTYTIESFGPAAFTTVMFGRTVPISVFSVALVMECWTLTNVTPLG